MDTDKESRWDPIISALIAKHGSIETRVGTLAERARDLRTTAAAIEAEISHLLDVGASAMVVVKWIRNAQAQELVRAEEQAAQLSIDDMDAEEADNGEGA
jgi:hypothetical protein